MHSGNFIKPLMHLYIMDCLTLRLLDVQVRHVECAGTPARVIKSRSLAVTESQAAAVMAEIRATSDLGHLTSVSDTVNTRGNTG